MKVARADAPTRKRMPFENMMIQRLREVEPGRAARRAPTVGTALRRPLSLGRRWPRGRVTEKNSNRPGRSSAARGQPPGRALEREHAEGEHRPARLHVREDLAH